jgi:hypothetical protein
VVYSWYSSIVSEWCVYVGVRDSVVTGCGKSVRGCEDSERVDEKWQKE